MKYLEQLKHRKKDNSCNTYLWHLRLDHINLNRIGRLVKSGLLSQLEDKFLTPCESCLEEKMAKRSFSEKGRKAK